MTGSKTGAYLPKLTDLRNLSGGYAMIANDPTGIIDFDLDERG